MNRPYRIGLFIDDVTGYSEYLTAVWHGAYGAARSYGVDLIIFSGGTLNYSPYNKFEKQRKKRRF